MNTNSPKGHCGYCYDGLPSPPNPNDPDSLACSNPKYGKVNLFMMRLGYKISIYHLISLALVLMTLIALLWILQ